MVFLTAANFAFMAVGAYNFTSREWGTYLNIFFAIAGFVGVVITLNFRYAPKGAFCALNNAVSTYNGDPLSV